MARMYIDKNGYKRYADSGIPVHRHVARRKLGGDVWDDHVVHHRDGNKLNNSRSNLQVMDRSRHSRLHSRKRNLFDW